MLMTQLHPQIVVLIEQHLLVRLVGTGTIAVHIIHNGQQVVGHRLQCQLVQQRRHTIEATIENQQLGARLLRSLAHCWLVGLVGIQFLLHRCSQIDISIPVAAIANIRIFA